MRQVFFKPWPRQLGEFINDYVTPMARWVQAGETDFQHVPLSDHSQQLLRAAFPEASHRFDMPADAAASDGLRNAFFEEHSRLPGAHVNDFARRFADGAAERQGRVLLVQRGSQARPGPRGFEDASAFAARLQQASGMPVDVCSLEEHSLKDQAQTIHSYRYVVIPHGAAMCYIRLFHRPGAYVYHLATPFAPLHRDHPKPHFLRDWARGYHNGGMSVRNIECMLFDMTLKTGERASHYSDCLPINNSLMQWYDPSDVTLSTLAATLLEDALGGATPPPALGVLLVVSSGGHPVHTTALTGDLTVECGNMKVNDYAAAGGLPVHGAYRHKDTVQTTDPVVVRHAKTELRLARATDGVLVDGRLVPSPRGMLTVMVVDQHQQRTVWP